MNRRGLSFTEEDEALIKRLQERLQTTMGKMSIVAVIRWALRQAEQSQKEDGI